MKTPDWLAPKKEQKGSLEALRIREQWASQVKILSKLGILETFPDSKQLGIRGIDGKEYPVPKPQEIEEMLEANREMVLGKMEQGFTKLVIEPFAYSFDALSEKYKRTILRHHKDGKLLATKDKPTDPDEPLQLDENQPLWRWEDGYAHCDTENKLVYFPKEFSKSHGGKTKKEALATDVPSGFNISLVETCQTFREKVKEKKSARDINWKPIKHLLNISLFKQSWNIKTNPASPPKPISCML